MPRRKESTYYDVRVQHQAECADCGASFTITVYPGDTTSQAFPRDHPQNGCYVKDVRAVRTKRLRK